MTQKDRAESRNNSEKSEGTAGAGWPWSLTSLLPLLRAVRTMSIPPEILLDSSKYRRGGLWKVGEHELVENLTVVNHL